MSKAVEPISLLSKYFSRRFAVPALRGKMSSRRRLESAAFSLTVGGSATRSKDPRVRLCSSLALRPVSAARRYSNARSFPESFSLRESDPSSAVFWRSSRNSNVVKARRSRRMSTLTFNFLRPLKGFSPALRSRTIHLQNWFIDPK